MKEYTSKNNANNSRWRKEQKILERMCPIFKKKCIGKKCMSWDKGNVYSVQRYDMSAKAHFTVWKYTLPNCSNAIVNGYIEAEMIAP